MSRTSLAPCPACSRHVRTSEVACPFCAVALLGKRTGAPSPRPAKGASRATVFAFQTALLATSACADTHERANHQADAGPVDDADLDAAVAQAGRGAPALDAGKFDNSPNPVSPQHRPTVTTRPEPEDDDGDGGYVPVPVYGGPFPDPRSRAKV